ncbi:hypothetical protein IIC45_02030 [Patescibacteria group bacterium]|nr:hypothetical protein [Patescibacteria group bacterium]
MKRILISLLIPALFASPLFALASVGVGVNLGKINIEEPLKPGGLYTFPVIGVINTGDTAGDYAFEVTYHQDQPELRPDAEWFSFSPSTFSLGAGESQNVEIQLSLPVKMKPGDYFAYLEAHPVVVSGPGTTIGIAAATKTYFTVVPANLWQALIHRVSSFFSLYAPWPQVVLAIIIGAVLLSLFRRFFSFNIGISRK